MISKITLTNFKKFRDNTFELNPSGVSILVGPNNSGKSTIIHALAIWEFSKMILETEDGRQALYHENIEKKQGHGLSAEEFLPVAVPSLGHLWTNLKILQQATGNFPGYSLRICCYWMNEKQEKYLEFGLSLVNDRLFIRVTKSNIQEGDYIPHVVYLPTFAGILPKENKITPAERRALIGKGMAGSAIRNMIFNLHQQDRQIKDELLKDHKRLSAKEKASLELKSPWLKLQRVLNEVFLTQLEVKPFNDNYHTVIRINERKGNINQQGKFEVYPLSRYTPRDIIVQGSGFLQWLSIFCILLEDDVDVLLLDEPDAHLHASLQNELINRLQEFSTISKTQILVSTHSVEIIKNTEINKIFSVFKNKYLHAEDSRVAELAGIGSEYSPLMHQLQNYRKILFVENESDYNMISRFAEIIGTPLPKELVLWPNTDTHSNRHKLFLELKKHIPDLKGFSIRDRDTESIRNVGRNLDFKGVSTVNDDIKLITWRRKNIESYYLCPDAIAKAAKVEVSKVVEYLNERHCLALPDNGNKCSSCPQILLDCDGKELFVSPQDGIEKIFKTSRAQVVESFDSNQVCDDMKTCIKRLNEHFEF